MLLHLACLDTEYYSFYRKCMLPKWPKVPSTLFIPAIATSKWFNPCTLLTALWKLGEIRYTDS